MVVYFLCLAIYWARSHIKHACGIIRESGLIFQSMHQRRDHRTGRNIGENTGRISCINLGIHCMALLISNEFYLHLFSFKYECSKFDIP